MALTAGIISQAAVSTASASLSSTPATGGVGPYTQQWYRSNTPIFTPGASNIIAGQTSLALSDYGLSQNTPYYYILVFTDTGAGNAQINSATFGLVTASQYVGNFQNPSVPTFASFFFRDFPILLDTSIATLNDNILVQDVVNAMQETNIQINPILFELQSEYELGYLYFTAHTLSENMVNASQGINGQYNFNQASKGVGPVSESFATPPDITNQPLEAVLCKTTYGKKYWDLIKPKLVGQMFTVRGRVSPI